MESERILIFGNGQIGNLYLNYFTEKGVPIEIAKADVTNEDEVRSAVGKFEPTVVINTAAKTNLEWCSDNKLETFNVNVLGADNIARVCDEKGIYFIHYSSGCIFQSEDENDAKREDDIPNPEAYYAWTKVWAENLIQNLEKSPDFKYLILRPRQPISSEFNYKNMLVKMLTFSKFIETPNTLTVLEDLMDWTEVFIEKKPVGILHVANEGWTTPYQLGIWLKEYVLNSMTFEKITKEELDELTPNRRVDTVLNVDKLKGIVDVVSTEQRAEETVKELAENIKSTDAETIKIQLDKTVEQSKSRTILNEEWDELLK